VRNAYASINLPIEYYDACLPQIGEALRCIALDQNKVGGFAHYSRSAETFVAISASAIASIFDVPRSSAPSTTTK